MSPEEEQEILLKQLGIKYKPSKKGYSLARNLIEYIITKGLKDSFEIKGGENLANNYFQFFTSNHVLFKDPALIQEAIFLTSKNYSPILSPGHKKWLFNPIVGMTLQKLYSIPIFSKKEGYIRGLPETLENTKREKSLDFIVDCLLKYRRLLIFPEGHLSRTGKLDKGMLGTFDISRRVYNSLEKKIYLKKDKEVLHIIPLNISYYPLEVFRNRKNGSKAVIRFGEPIDFEKEVINKFYTFKNKFEDNESREIKKELK